MDDQEAGHGQLDFQLWLTKKLVVQKYSETENKKKLPKRREILIRYYCDSKEKEDDGRY